MLLKFLIWRNISDDIGGSIRLEYEKVPFGDYFLECNVLRVRRGETTISTNHLIETQRRLDPCFSDWSNQMNLANIRIGYGYNRNDYDSCPSHAGHILAHSLGGPEAMWNVFPQDPTVNTGGYKTLEMRIKKCLEDNEDLGIKANLKWEFIYDDVKYITKPKQVNYTAWFTYKRGEPFEKECFSGKLIGGTFYNYYINP